jgi:hypothetical protein
MVKYECEKCNKIFYKKSLYTEHLSTKIICTDRIKLKINDNKCIYCNKILSCKGNVIRHIKDGCKKVKSNLQELHKIFDILKEKEQNKIDTLNEKKTALLKQELNDLKQMKLQNEIDKLKCTIIQNSNNTIMNSNNIQNIQNTNIYLIGYGKEDLTKLKQKEIIKALNRGFMSPIGLTETIHFNPKYPEYHNVYISSMKDKYAMVYDGKTWNLVNKAELVDQIYDEKKDFISENFEEFYDSLTPSKRNALKEWFDMDDDDPKIKNIKDEIKMLLYNKRKMIQKHNIINNNI